MVTMPQITEHDWLDDIIDSPLKNLKLIPRAKPELLLVSILGSIIGVVGTYYTANWFLYACSLILAVSFNTTLFLSLYGVEHTETEQKPLRTTYQQLVYDRRIAELEAEHDFNETVNQNE
jgi:hypothetical protein